MCNHLCAKVYNSNVRPFLSQKGKFPRGVFYETMDLNKNFHSIIRHPL